MTGLFAQISNHFRVSALAAAIIAATLLAASSAPAATEEYGTPGLGGVSGAPPLTTGETPATAPPVTGVPGTTTSGEVIKGKGKNKDKAKKKDDEEKLVELGPARPPTIAAPVSAVTRGTTPGLLPLAAVLAGLIVAALIGRRVIRKQTA